MYYTWGIYFLIFFSIPYCCITYYQVSSALLFSLPPSRNSDPESHSRLFSPLPTMVRALHFHREKIPALCSLVDSRRIVPTHATRSQQLILFFSPCFYLSYFLLSLQTDSKPYDTTAGFEVHDLSGRVIRHSPRSTHYYFHSTRGFPRVTTIRPPGIDGCRTRTSYDLSYTR